MGWARKHWKGLLGALSLLASLWRPIKSALEFGEHAEFIGEHVKDLGWVGTMIGWLMDPPPASTVPLILLGLGLIYWDFRRRPGKLGPGSQPPPALVTTPVPRAAAVKPENTKARKYAPPELTVERLFNFFEEHTAFQANELTKRWLGLWMTVPGTVQSVGAFNGYFVQVVFEEKFGSYRGRVFCLFREPLPDRLPLLRVGDKITIIGQLESIDAIALNLNRCEIVG